MNHLSSFLLGIAALLSSCDSQPTMRDTLPPDAAAELTELMDEILPVVDERTFFKASKCSEELLEMFEVYNATGNPRLCCEVDGHTPLHLAVLFGCEALVRELLRQGADPNAQLGTDDESQEGIRPLVWTVQPMESLGFYPRPDASIRLIDALVAAGAEVKGTAGSVALRRCAANAVGQEVFLHLLDLGAVPMPGETAQEVLDNGWFEAAEYLLAAGMLPADARITVRGSRGDLCQPEEVAGMVTLLYRLLPRYMFFAGSEEGEEWQRRNRETLSLLLEKGADVNAPQEDVRFPGLILTPLLGLLEFLPGDEVSPARLEACGWLVLQLLQHGGRLDARYPQNALRPQLSGKSVAEILRAHPRLAAWLEARGVSLAL